MNETVIDLAPIDLLVAAGLLLIAGAVSIALRLGLVRRLAWAGIRSTVQLILLGHLLRWVFGIDRATIVVAVLAVMIVAAGRAAVRRPERTFRGATVRGVVSLALPGLAITFTVTGIILQVEPWHQPQYLLPLLGMVLGNSLTGVSLALDYLLETLDQRRHEIRDALALGATRWEASQDAIGAAVRRGMIPILNAMSVVGIVSLPGMMTGQILAGADPLVAVEYQLVVMFMLAASSALGAVAMVLLTFQRLFDADHRLRSERIES